MLQPISATENLYGIFRLPKPGEKSSGSPTPSLNLMFGGGVQFSTCSALVVAQSEASQPQAGDGKRNLVGDEDRPFDQTQLMLGVQACPLDTVEKLFPVDSFAEFFRLLPAASSEKNVHLLPSLQ